MSNLKIERKGKEMQTTLNNKYTAQWMAQSCVVYYQWVYDAGVSLNHCLQRFSLMLEAI